MRLRKRTLRIGLLSAVVLGSLMVQEAMAAPVLQLDIINGRYDTTTKTTVATTEVFTLVALWTRPDWMTRDDAAAYYFNQTYYLAAAITPKVNTQADLGSFVFDSNTSAAWNPVKVAVTGGMSYGNPPLEATGSAYDSGDFEPHDIYNTYFREFSFQFNATQQTAAYDVTQTRNGFDPTGTGAYYALFTVDTTLLADPYAVHFDLYSTKMVSCNKYGTYCADEDLDLGGEHRYDAQSAPVPEPASLLLVSLGLGLCRLSRRRERSA